MKSRTACPCCGSDSGDLYPAMIAAWISEYVLESPRRTSTLKICAECECKFFTDRYDDAECDRLYEDYRGERYFAVRHKHEFWYTRKTNDSFAHDESEISRRRAVLKSTLLDNVGELRIDSILDYGGDRGQFIPDICTDRYSYDVSGVQCVPGVKGITSRDDLGVYDCVMLCHVLEHVADPVAFLADVGRHVRRGGSILIVLPCERFSVVFVPKRGIALRIYRRYLALIRKLPLLERIIDFCSTVSKIKLNCIPPLGFIKQSEHLTIFNETAISRMVEHSGFAVQGRIFSGRHAIFGKEFICVARKLDPA